MIHKIAYLCGTKAWGGLEMNQIRNAEWMRDRGHTVVIFCLKDSPVYNAEYCSKYWVFIPQKNSCALFHGNGI